VILVTGAAGMVGSYCRWDDAVRTDIDDLDVRSWTTVRERIGELRPGWVLHLAAETDVDACEVNPTHAFHTNALGTRNVVLACLEFDVPLAYISTAGVFDGTKPDPYHEFDPPYPINVYGRSKLAGEQYVRAHLPRAIVARAGWMMGGGPELDKKFVGKIIAQFRDPEPERISAVDDKFGSPTYAADLVAALRHLMERERFGIVHLAGRGAASRFSVACRIHDLLGSAKPVVPVPSTAFPLAAPRPRSEVLCSLVQELDSEVRMRGWEEALADYLEREWC
jgi:dTDP-4-dehydrorhamnose reductase